MKLPARVRTARPRLETLEDRLVPALFEVVPAGADNGYTTFASLQSALVVAQSGDTVQIEPGSSPGDGTVSRANITIRGDGAFGGAAGLRASGTQVSNIGLFAKNETVTDLFLAHVTIGAGDTGETVSDCILTPGAIRGATISQNFSTGTSLVTNGQDSILGDTFLAGASVSLGNTPGDRFNTANSDTIADNVFTDTVAQPITVSNETTGLSVSGNRVENADPSFVMSLVSLTDCTGTVSGNSLNYNNANTGGPSNTGINIADNGSGDAQATNLTVSNNVAAGRGTGVSIGRGSSANFFTVTLTGNSLAGDTAFGVSISGDQAGGGNDYGTIVASGNDFRGYASGHYAIDATDGIQTTTDTVNAQGNIFSAADPRTAVRAFSGSIDVSNPLTGGGASLTAMFLTLGGGPPTVAQHSALDGASAAQQAQAAVHSNQALKALVDGLYVSLLGRTAGAGEDQGWVNALANGSINEEQLVQGFVGSPEYYEKVTQGHDSPNGAWVQSLYLSLLSRQGSSAEINAWVGALPSIGLSGVVGRILASAEFRGIQVGAMFGLADTAAMPTPNILKRAGAPSPADVAGWANSGLDLLGIEEALLATDEFAANG